jgi:hypothetical protein
MAAPLPSRTTPLSILITEDNMINQVGLPGGIFMAISSHDVTQTILEYNLGPLVRFDSRF